MRIRRRQSGRLSRGRSGYAAALALLLIGLGTTFSSACKTSPPTTAGAGGGGGAGGCKGGPPVAGFELVVHVVDGTLPEDLSIAVKWSAGAEPVFSLDDPESWMTLDEGSNLVCEAQHDAGVVDALKELRCELWTSGATEIIVAAEGYITVEDTLTPDEIDTCAAPVTKQVEVELLPDVDGGMP